MKYNMNSLELSRKIKSGELKVVDVVRDALDSMEEKDKDINAIVKVCREQALEEAATVQEKIDKGELDSPLAGVPIVIKDNICTKGIDTTCASKILQGFLPPYDATVISKLKEAGMIIVGKSNMDEFAMGSTTETSYYGPTKNPRDLNKVPGGSSGGSAAAVAAGEIGIALGSDTGGSIRQPAAYCGVSGFKPTYGTVSRYGLIAYASSLDQIGPLANTVEECAAITDVIKGKDEFDGTSLELLEESYLKSLTGEIKGIKVALPEECFDENLDESVKTAVLNMAHSLEKLGATVEKVSLPFMKYVIPTYYILATAEASSNLSRFDGVKYGYRTENYEELSDLYENTRSEGFGFETQKRILLGTFVLSSGYYDAYYRKALQVKSVIIDKFNHIFDQYDVIICPAAPTTAPKLGNSLSDPMKMYLSDIYTVSANIAGLPGLSIPCGKDKDGMPIGVQILGQRLSDAKVLNVGYSYQKLMEES